MSSPDASANSDSSFNTSHWFRREAGSAEPGHLTISRTTTVSVDVEEGGDHLGRVCPAIHIRDSGVPQTDGTIEWKTFGVVEVTSSNLATEEARAKIGARSAEGHSAYILGDEIIVACDACGWTYDPMEGGDKISYSSAPAEQ